MIPYDTARCLHEAMTMALEALESCGAGHISDGGNQWHDEKLVDKAITVLREALAAQEPVFSFQMQLRPGWGGQYPRAVAIGEPDIESLFGKVGDVVTFYASPQPAQIAGFDVVLDSSMSPNTMKFVQPEQQEMPDGWFKGMTEEYRRKAWRIKEQPAPVQGWKMVPVEPTREIEDAIAKARTLKASEIWGDAIAAAPQPAQEPVAWMEMVVANLVREGVNKHKARELAEHFYSLRLEQPAPVQGWKMVPVEPTQKMLDAPPNAYPADALVTWEAMLAAAPQPAVQQEPASNGWKLVPIEPTNEMMRAFFEAAGKWVNEGGADEDVYIAMLEAAPNSHECTRSHPHENMDAMCELRTEIARLANENARLKAKPVPVQQEPATKDVVIDNMGKPFTVKAYVDPQPAQRPWVGLTWQDWNGVAYTSDFRRGAEWADAQLREKNT